MCFSIILLAILLFSFFIDLYFFITLHDFILFHIKQWDQSCVLKKTPMVLSGGYKDFMRKYPMCTTQALNFDLMTNLQMNPVVTDFSGMSFSFYSES